MKSSAEKQSAALLAALRSGPITALQALDKLGIARASARVCDLRREGWNISSQMITVRNRRGEDCRVAQYTLVSPQASLVPGLEQTMRRAA